MREGHKHYVRTNEAGIIIHSFSDAFEAPQEGDILICEDGPRHFHEAFPQSLVNDRGQFRFRWSNGRIIERTQQELEDEWTQRPPAPPSLQQRVEAAEQALRALLEVL